MPPSADVWVRWWLNDWAPAFAGPAALLETAGHWFKHGPVGVWVAVWPASDPRGSRPTLAVLVDPDALPSPEGHAGRLLKVAGRRQ